MIRLLVILLALAPALALSATDPRYCGPPQRASDGSILRSKAVVREFRSIHPCPSTGLKTGRCPGWAVDHVVPLAACGCDSVSNLQWLPLSIKAASGAHAKDRWERRVYSCPLTPANPVRGSSRLRLGLEPGVKHGVRRSPREQTVADRASTESGSLSPLADGRANTVVFDEHVVPPVAVLFDVRSPSAVVGVVALVHVDAVNRQAWRGFTHVGQEVVERQPPLTHRDTPPAVPLERRAVWVSASGEHAPPDSVGSSASPVRAVPVPPTLLPYLLPRQLGTSARDAAPVTKMVDRGQRFAPAITHTAPDDFPAATQWRRFDGHKATEPSSVNVERFHVVHYTSVGSEQWLPSAIKSASGAAPKDRWERRVYCGVGS